jgi:glyoxylase I family protein
MSDAAARESTVTVRYQVGDIERSIAFYTERFAFKVGTKSGAAFADVSRENLRLLLSGPGSSGSRAMPDGRRQEPGGWNRIVLTVDDLASQIATLEKAGVRFRNQIEAGPGGKQILIEDPDGNLIELHEYPRDKSP